MKERLKSCGALVPQAAPAAFVVSAPPVTCAYRTILQSAIVPVTAGSGTGTVLATPGCPWTVASDSSWLTITSGTSGVGNGSFIYNIAANTGQQSRTATIMVGTQTLTVTQMANCSFGILASSISVSAVGGPGSINVTPSDGSCPWSAVSNTPDNHTGASNTGTGTINYSVAVNGVITQRSGSFTIAGQIIQVIQAGAACIYSVDFPVTSPTAAGGSGTAAVTVLPGCAWTATSNSNWLTITGTPNGAGNGSFTFTIAANNGVTSRTAIVTVGTQTVSITQAGIGCSFAIGGSSITVGALGATGTIGISTSNDNCSWLAVSNVPWLTITSNPNGVGSGTVAYTAVSNANVAARSGNLTIAGITFTVNQSGVIGSLTIMPVQANTAAAGGSGEITITTNAPDFAWTAVSSAAWLTITSAPNGIGSYERSTGRPPQIQQTRAARPL